MVLAHVEVVARYQGSYGQLNRKLLAAVAAGQAPTLAQSYNNWTEQLLKAGAIVPLDSFVKGADGLSAQEIADFWPVLLEASRWDGVLWSLPFNKSICVQFYNATVYKEPGLSAPTDWDSPLKAPQATTRRQGDEVVRYGYGLRPNVDAYVLFLLTNGGAWLTQDYKHARFNEPPGVEALQFMSDLIHRYKVAYYIPGYLEQDFAAGKVAAYATSMPGRPYMEQAVGNRFESGVAPLPTRVTKRIPVAGTDVVIFASARTAGGSPAATARGRGLSVFRRPALAPTRSALARRTHLGRLHPSLAVPFVRPRGGNGGCMAAHSGRTSSIRTNGEGGEQRAAERKERDGSHSLRRGGASRASGMDGSHAGASRRHGGTGRLRPRHPR